MWIQPGLHLGEAKAINRIMNKTAAAALKDVDVVLFVIDADRWTEEDEAVLAKSETRSLSRYSGGE